MQSFKTRNQSKWKLSWYDFLLLTIGLAIISFFSITAILYRDQIQELENWGYLGIAIANAVGSATLIFPLPSFATVILGATTWNPIFVGIAGATGSTIGEFTAYIAGASTRSSVNRVMAGNKWYKRIKSWMSTHGFLTILVMTAIPNPLVDIVGLASGSLRYSAKRFLFACWLGKLIKFISVALASYWGTEVTLKFFG